MYYLYLLLCSSFLIYVDAGRVQQLAPTKYVVSGEMVTLACPMPGLADLLKWKFQANGSEIILDAGQVFPGGITKIFNQFDLPPGRSQIVTGMLQISQTQVKDEGNYWCEISSLSSPSVLSDKMPVHVWVTPLEPVVTGLHVNGSILEHTVSKVARCSSKAGKPESNLVWMNGSQVLPTGSPVIEKNSFSDVLWDISLDLVLDDPTRFDHERPFQCVVDHPAYKGQPKVMNYSVNVLYHPVNIRIWANLTGLEVFCEADGFPGPSYSWVIPGNVEGFTGETLYMPNLFSLSGYEYFECTASNGIPEPITLRVMVNDLRYPNGKPGLLGLEWYIWAAIGGGVLLVIILVVVGVCCYCKRSKKSSGSRSKGKGGSAKYKSPAVKASGMRHSQPSLLDFDNMRTPDGRESSKAPSEVGYQKASMARSYSLEHLVEEKYGGGNNSGVTLMPTNRLSRGDMYDDTSLNRRASREELDKVADHIEVLNKSWDHLAKSREHLNRSREELHVEMPPRYESHEDLNQAAQYGSRERLTDPDNYPYMDDTLDQRNRSRSRDYRDPRDEHRYHGNQQQYDYDRQDHDGYQGNSGYGQQYDDRGYNGQSGHYDDQGYGNSQDQYNQGYDSRYNQQEYDDSTYNAHHQGNQGYDQSQHGYDRGGYADDEFDDQDHDYNRGYQPASMI